MRMFLVAAVFGLGALGFAGAGTAQADPGHGGHHRPGYGYYGNGAHDLVPHWHQARTPFGPTYWYGNGVHDLVPHGHRVSPWGGVRSYSYTQWGPTKSYNGFPGYYYRPYYGRPYGGGW
jgi:hypothetical protein